MYTDVTGNIGAEVGSVIAILFIIVMVTVIIIPVVVAVIKWLVNLHTDCTYIYNQACIDFCESFKCNMCVHTVLIGLHCNSLSFFLQAPKDNQN